MKTATDVTAAVKSMARVFDRTLEGETIAFFARVLLNRLSADEACEAIAKWCATQARWPAPANIIGMVHPQVEARDEAAELVQRLRATIARRGYTWESTYRYDGYDSIDEAIMAELGDEGLAIVQRCGGWAAFCREWGGENGDTSARAQLRGLCEAALKNTAASPALALPAKRTQGLEHISGILGGLPSKPRNAT
jgi:hypothetical protein